MTMTLPGLGPLPEIEPTRYVTGDIVVYDGFVFTVVQNNEDGNLTIEDESHNVQFVPSTAVSLL
ncbi:hypothetical protein [Synechococcus phage S-N03]|uniref:Uncharacterized protein n=1 Tax=Synechococcus phage S-N03 TaxID=2718943 RepID=A0A6G8R5R1_9CAUD|nr:hypothetical protein PQC09_gp091 [Synechococcus phage S-N03]QIN96726.1 hypothetical protein [Synechococcus phage S-N03]